MRDGRAGKEGDAIRQGAGRAHGGTKPMGLLRDAWLFFMLLLLLAVVVFVLKPARLLDRFLGTRLTGRLVSIIEMVAEL